ncbi:hypothetical protein LQW54_004938 [Pestalotiopsis sp. IQ-011]
MCWGNSYVCRSSAGEPRNAVSPDPYAEAFSAAADYLGTRDFVDAGRVGAVGVCGSGSLVISATKIDARTWAVATVSMYDMGTVAREGLLQSQSVERRRQIIAEAAQQRVREAHGAATAYIGGALDALVANATAVERGFFDYYRTFRGQVTPPGSLPNLTTHPTMSSKFKFLNFYPLNDFSEDAYERAAEPEELAGFNEDLVTHPQWAQTPLRA